MKKIFALACTTALAVSFIACGPSEEERKKDSADVAGTAVEMIDAADRMADSMEKADRDAMRADSLRNDSIAKAAGK
jgi:hypothetical protein